MPVSVAVTTLADGIQDSRRFVDVSLALTGTYTLSEALNGFAIPLNKLPFDEVTDVYGLGWSGSPASGGGAVRLSGTKSAPRIQLRGYDPATGLAMGPVDGSVTPALPLRVRIVGA